MTLIDDSRLERPLPAPIKKVLETMFAAYSQVIVKSEFSEGFSGSRVFLVRSIREDGRSELPSAVKVDEIDRIKKEWRAYQDCIRNRLPGVAGISDTPVYPPDNQYGGLRYPLAGDGAFNVVSLQDYCRQASIDDIGYVLERLFKSLEKIWEQKNFQPEFRLHTAYDSFLHPNLLIECTAALTEATLRDLSPNTVQKQSRPHQIGDGIKLSGFQVVRVSRKSRSVVLDMPSHLPNAYRLQVQSVPNIDAFKVGQIMPSLTGRVKQTREGALQELAKEIVGPGVDVTAVSLPRSNGDSLPNPLVALPQLLTKSFDAYTACIHADLHLGNVLVEPESRNIHLIDFVNAREDHVLRDFLNLELAVVNRQLPAAFDKAELIPKRIIPFYERLHCALRYPGQVSQPPGLEKPFALLRMIREAARHYLCKQNEWGEYYTGLVFYLLGSLRYDDMKKMPGARQAAFWGAATTLKLLETETACDEFRSDNNDDKSHSSPSGSEKGEARKDDIARSAQTQTHFYGPVSGPIHTGSGNINISGSPGSQKQKPPTD